MAIRISLNISTSIYGRICFAPIAAEATIGVAYDVPEPDVHSCVTRSVMQGKVIFVPGAETNTLSFAVEVEYFE